MADEIDKEIIRLGLDLDPRKAVSEISKFQKSLSKKMGDAEKATKKLDKGFLKFVKQLKTVKEQSKGIKMLDKDFRVLERSANKNLATLKAMIKNAKTLTGDQRKAAVEQIRAQKKSLQHGAKRAAMGGIKKHAEAAAEADVMDLDSLREAAEEAGDSLTSPLRDLLAKDAPGLFKKATLGVAKGFSLAGRLGAGKGNLGGWAARHGDRMMAKGGASKVAGAGLKGIEKLSTALGPVLNIFAKIGPILSVASGFMMSFVKIMVDAESGAKEFNKQILATAGTGKYLSASFGNISAASKDLDRDLTAARTASVSLRKYGINKETSAAFLNALTAEGVSLKKLGGNTDDLAKRTEAYSKTITMGVVYSRAFGVSLSEVSQLQGDLMSNLGMGAKGVTANFQQIVNAASEAGMETNKFFGLVRSFSTDLSLFALRMETVTKVLGVLGKTMDPRNAQKFLQNLNQKFSGGDTADNLKYEIIAGTDETHKLLKSELGDKLTNLRQDLTEALEGVADNKAIDNLVKMIANPNSDERKIAQESAKYQGKISGGIEEMITEIRNLTKKVGSQDPIDAASVMDLLNPLKKMELLNKASVKLTGKGFDQLSGLSMLAVEKAGIASAKEIREYQKFQKALLLGQEQLIQRVETGKATDQDKRQLKRLGISGTGPADIEKLKSTLRGDGGAKKFYDTMGDSQKDLVNQSFQQRDFQEEISDKQTSLLDNLEMIGDFIMNEIYNVMHNIWQVITDLYDTIVSWIGDSRQKDAAAARKFASGIPELEKALQAADPNKASEQAIATFGKGVLGNIQKAVAEYKQISEAIKTEKDPAKKKEMVARSRQLRPALNYASASEKSLRDISKTKGLHLMVARLIEMKKAVDKVPGLGTATTTTAPTAPGKPQEAPLVKRGASPNVKPSTDAAQQKTTDSVSELHKTVADKGVKVDPSTISGPLSDSMSKSVYEGTSRALFEYYMYSSLDRTSVATAMKSGASQAAIAQSMGTGEAPSTALAKLMSPNAEGGVVSGIANGMARISRFPAAPAGEGWASVGRGEKILPAGGGGGSTKVELELKGDFKRFINARIVEGTAAHDRNKKFR